MKHLVVRFRVQGDLLLETVLDQTAERTGGRLVSIKGGEDGMWWTLWEMAS